MLGNSEWGALDRARMVGGDFAETGFLALKKMFGFETDEEE